MKVAILTFHAAHNFGSMLQAYALQTTIVNAGHECKIINLRTSEQKTLYDYRSEEIHESNILKKIIKRIVFSDVFSGKKNQYDLFEKFMSDYMYLTPEYSNIAEIESNLENFDVFISGSDQIWNINTKDYNDAYMLAFKNEGRRVAYAVSAGSGNCNFEEYKDLLKAYQRIGVREYNLKEKLAELSIPSTITVDPTLLLSSDNWSELRNQEFEKKLPKRYILFYSLGYHEDEKNILKYLRKKYKMPILSPHRLYTKELVEGILLVKNCGPREFVSLFARASLIFTTSFHGCVFSTLFEKEFFAYLPNEGHVDERKRSFLKITRQEYRGINSLEDIINIANSAENNLSNLHNWDKAEIEESKKFLLDSIG